MKPVGKRINSHAACGLLLTVQRQLRKRPQQRRFAAAAVPEEHHLQPPQHIGQVLGRARQPIADGVVIGPGVAVAIFGAGVFADIGQPSEVLSVVGKFRTLFSGLEDHYCLKRSVVYGLDNKMAEGWMIEEF
jgi:hypothetical protein